MRARRAIAATSVAAVALVGAGISGTGHAAPAFGTPVRTGGSGYEPGIDVGTDGRVWVNDPSGAAAHGQLFVSNNGGSTFSRITFPDPQRRYPGGFDSDGVAGHNGRFYFIDLSVVSNSVYSTDNGGATWSTGTIVSSLPLSDRQWGAVGPLDANGNETVYVVSALIQPPSTMMLARSDDSGKTFTWHSIAPGVAMGGGFTGQLVADDTGFVAFTFEDANRLYLARSTDKGQSWTRVAVNRVSGSQGATVFGGHIQGLALEGDTMHAVWIDRIWHSVKYARSTDKGLTWEDEVEIEVPGSNMFPWVAVRGGKVAAAWYSADVSFPANPNGLPTSTKWYVHYTESVNGGAWTTPVNVHPNYVKLGFICTAGLSCNAGRELGDFMQVAIDSAGKSLVTYGSFGTSPTGELVAKQI